MITDEEIEVIEGMIFDGKYFTEPNREHVVMTLGRAILDIMERLRAAEAVVAKLPKSADGVPVTPGRVYLTQDIYRTVQAQFDIRDLGDNWYHYHQVYSTEAAARAASAASPGAHGGTEGAGKP